jgi:hypothetical protein
MDFGLDTQKTMSDVADATANGTQGTHGSSAPTSRYKVPQGPQPQGQEPLFNLGNAPYQGPAGNVLIAHTAFDAPYDKAKEPKTAGPSGRFLGHDDRVEMLRQTGNRITKAFVGFVDACNRHRDSVKAIAAKKEKLWSAIVDVALGALIPGLGAALGSLVDKIPVASSDALYAFALKMQDTSFVKMLVTGATKAGAWALKKGVKVLASEDVTDVFMNTLKTQCDTAFDAIDGSLKDRSDEELIATYVAFDPSITNGDTYAAQLEPVVNAFEQLRQGDFGNTHDKHQGRSQGEWTYAWSETRLIAQVGDHLAVVKEKSGAFPGGHGWGTTKYETLTIIPPDMEDLARQTAKDAGQEIIEIHNGD